MRFDVRKNRKLTIYPTFTRLVMAGDLSKPDAILCACESFWDGGIEWAVRNGYDCMENRRIPF
ncbi:kanamycin nucleotidyltransferase C-terminal domain-containing protein [Brevibacillus sp. LEMMJ03]|uniref:kanamycin nucleotidyltransferase C-terminal domain-containing protein n=1 Tax=Brevibacillus sp. LEMMJ03 TaxID=2595056 RepID=UPI00351AF843